jgi:hypothetical protein
MAGEHQPVPDSTTLVRLLADRDRRLVVAGLVLGASEPGDIAAQVGLGLREVMSSLDRLVAGGLVERLSIPGEGERFHLLEEAFQLAARSEAAAAAGQDRPSRFADHPADVRHILERALPAGRLAALPTKHAKRLVVLDHIAQRFEPGVHYTEHQVNAALRPLNEDVATLRRWLVDTGMLDRADGTYWRSGGSVEA